MRNRITEIAMLILAAYFTIQTWQDHGVWGVLALLVFTAVLWMGVRWYINWQMRRDFDA